LLLISALYLLFFIDLIATFFWNVSVYYLDPLHFYKYKPLWAFTLSFFDVCFQDYFLEFSFLHLVFFGTFSILLGCFPFDYLAYPYSLSPLLFCIILYRLVLIPVRFFLYTSLLGTTYIVFAIYQLFPSSICISLLTIYLHHLLLQICV